MRNLKRVLTLVMAVAMMMSLLVVGAGAAFPDQDKIKNTDAVNMNVALGVIKGRDTGVFDPSGNVTRGEMAKMICIVLNGGNEPTVGAKATPTFKDIKGHWAEGYIEYCYALGIVAGMGDGTFAPNANVTGTQAAKMLLVALGYDAAFEGFNGASWAVKINVAASQKVLYDELAVDPNAPLNRDDAAQMIWNALNATEVKYEYSLTTVNGQLMNIQKREDKVDSLLKVRFKTGADFEKVMTGYSWNSTDKKFTYTFANGTQFKTKEDFTKLFAMNVKVVYKGTAGTGATVYGMYAEDSKVLATGIMDDLEIVDGGEIKFNGTKYKLDNSLAGTTVYAENATATLNLTSAALISNKAVTTAYAPFNAKLIDNDNDGKVDCIVYLPVIVEKITYVDSKSVSTNNNTYKFDDCDIYSGIAKNDWVMVVDGDNASKGDTILKKLDVVTGTINSKKSSDQIVIEGKTYTNAANPTGDTNYKIGNKMELVVVNGFIFNAKKVATAASSDKLVLVTNADPVGTGTEAGKQQVKVIFADGTKKVVKIAKIDGNDVKDAPTGIAPNLVYGTVEGTDKFFDYEGKTGTHRLNTVFTYTLNKDGNYEIETIGATDYDATKTATTASLKDGKMVISVGDTGTVRFADDAVVFYLAAGEYKVATGAAVNKWNEYASGTIAGKLYANESNGFLYTQAGFLTLNTAPSDKNTMYGYITAKPELVKVGSDYYYQIKIWNGTETKTYNAESTNSGGTVGSSSSLSNIDVAKGTAVSYKISGDGIVEKVTALTHTNAVTAYVDGKNYVGFQATVPTSKNAAAKELKLTSDTAIIRFSSKDVEGLTGNAITVAKEMPSANGMYLLNCYVIANTDDEIEALIIDKDNAVGGSNVTTGNATGVLVSASAPIYTANGTVLVKNATTATQLTNVAAGWTGAANAIVVNNNANTAVAAGTVLTDAFDLLVFAADGTSYRYDIQVQAAAPTALALAPATVTAPTIGQSDLLAATGTVTGWINNTADLVKITATPANGTSCTITINGVAYNNGANYDIAAANVTYNVVVTSTAANYVTTTYNYSFTVTAAPAATEAATVAIVAGGTQAAIVDDGNVKAGTAAVSAWEAGVKDTIKLNVAPAANTAIASITINGVSYTNGTDYAITQLGVNTVIVNVTGAGMTPHSYTYTFTVA